jgi:hypothetical protein
VGVVGTGVLSGLTVEDDVAGSRAIGAVVGPGDHSMKAKTAITSKIVTTVTTVVVLVVRSSTRG